MHTIGEEGSNALDAASELLELLRLAHEATHRLKKDVHGQCFENADAFSKKLLALREEAELLNIDVTKYVKEIESK